MLACSCSACYNAVVLPAGSKCHGMSCFKHILPENQSATDIILGNKACSCLQEAEVHVSSAAVKGAVNTDTILVEMPADFDIAGDAGSIGRFALQPRNSREAMQMDIKGTVWYSNQSGLQMASCMPCAAATVA